MLSRGRIKSRDSSSRPGRSHPVPEETWTFETIPRSPFAPFPLAHRPFIPRTAILSLKARTSSLRARTSSLKARNSSLRARTSSLKARTSSLRARTLSVKARTLSVKARMFSLGAKNRESRGKKPVARAIKIPARGIHAGAQGGDFVDSRPAGHPSFSCLVLGNLAFDTPPSRCSGTITFETAPWSR
jgi:hypothetical protein